MTAETAPTPEQAADQIDRWSRSIVQPLLVTILITSLLGAVLIVISQILGEPWLTLWPLYALFFLESVYSTRWLRRPNQRLLAKGIFRASEFVVFAILFRLMTWWLFAGPISAEMIQEFVYNPFLIFDMRFVSVLIMAFFGWSIVNRLIVLFEFLGIDAAEYAFFTTTPSEREQNARPVSLDRSLLVSDLFRYWVMGGILLTIIIGLTTLQLDQIVVRGNLFSGRASVPFPLLVISIVYMISGFLILSQARLAAYSARWLMSGISPNPAVERRWHRSGIRRIFWIALLAALLPIGSTFPLLRILQFIVNGLFAILSGIILFMRLLFGWFLSLFPTITEGGAEALPPPLPLEPLPLPTPAPAPPPPPPDNSIPIISILFWILFVVIAVESILFFLNARGFRVPRLMFTRLFGELRAMWLRWQERWRYRRALLAELTKIEPPDLAVPRPDRRWAFWRRALRYDHLPPRARIRLFFLTLVRLGRDAGIGRYPGETPAEFSRRFQHETSAAAADVDTLTDLFKTARYATSTIDDADAKAAEEAWKQLQQNLTERKKKREKS